MKRKAFTAVAAISMAMMMMSQAAADDNVIKIGIFEPLTGENGGGGTQEAQAADYANEVRPTVTVDGVEYTVELDKVDNKSDKTEAVTAAQKLVSDGVTGVLGTYGSGCAIAAGPTFAEAKVPAIGTSCTNPQVTANNDYYFRACFIDPFQGTVMANYAFKQGAKKVAIVQEVSNDYSVGLAKFFVEAFKKLTNDPNCIIDIANYQTGDKDFTAVLTNLKAKNPDAVFAPGNFTESALLIKQARQLGMKVPFMGGDTWETQEFIDVGGKDVEGCVLSTAFDREKASTEEAKKFLKAYTDEYKGEPSALSALGYDSYLIAIDAIKRAGGTDSKKIRDAIATTKDLEAVTGKTTLDKNGDAIKAAVIKVVKDGKFKYLDFVDVK